MDEWIMERYSLAKERIGEIVSEREVQEPYVDFFRKTASFLRLVTEVLEQNCREMSLKEHEEQNQRLYKDILPENYADSYGNPAYAALSVELQ